MKQSSENPDWVPEFRKEIDGVIIVAGDCQHSVNKKLHKALDVLGSTVKEVLNLSGHSRPGKEDGHEQ